MISANAEVALLDPEGNAMPPGQPDEICVRHPIAMAGSWCQPDQTAEAFADGMLHTGDIATMDAEGRLTILDCRKDMVVTGGFNVYPRGVEDVLASHPRVAMAAVIGVPDVRWARRRRPSWC
jgi:fatty-acyl-CoA synthase